MKIRGLADSYLIIEQTFYKEDIQQNIYVVSPKERLKESYKSFMRALWETGWLMTQ